MATPERTVVVFVRGPWLLLGLALAAGAAVRFDGLTERSLWFDEAYSWRMAQNDVSDILGRLLRDNTPPLYYLLIKVRVSVFGDCPTALRVPRALCSLAAVIGMVLFVHALLARLSLAGDMVSMREKKWASALTTSASSRDRSSRFCAGTDTPIFPSATNSVTGTECTGYQRGAGVQSGTPRPISTVSSSRQSYLGSCSRDGYG